MPASMQCLHCIYHLLILCHVLQKCLDVRHPEEIFEAAVVRQGLLVVPCIEKKHLGGERPDLFVIPVQILFECHRHAQTSTDIYTDPSKLVADQRHVSLVSRSGWVCSSNKANGNS